LTSPNPVSSRIERRRTRTREALLNAAQQLLSTRAAGAINVDEITELADVAKGTFYNYFTDKDALIREAEESARRELEQRIAECNANISDPAARVARAFAAMLDWSLAEPLKARMVLRMSPHFADPDAPLNSGVRADVHGGVANGRFSVISDEAGVVLVLGIISSGVNRALDLGQKAKAHALGENLAEALLVALGLERTDATGIAKSAMSEVG
jgi:AcrR family transcriptional regulator